MNIKRQLKKNSIAIIILVVLFSCKEIEKNNTITNYRGDDVNIEIDSVCRPELAIFNIRLSLSNFTKNNVVLIFNADSGRFHTCLKNMFLISETDTFNLFVGENYLIFKNETKTSFNCKGFFLQGKGSFKSLKEINDFKKLKLIYIKDDDLPIKIKQNLNCKSDTFLFPIKIIGTAENVRIVDYFLPNSYNLYEVQINRKNLSKN